MDKYHCILNIKAKETLEGEQKCLFRKGCEFSGTETKNTENSVKCLISASSSHFKYFCTLSLQWDKTDLGPRMKKE